MQMIFIEFLLIHSIDYLEIQQHCCFYNASTVLDSKEKSLSMNEFQT